MINEAHQKAGRLGFPSVTLLGIPAYYRRFGYGRVSACRIKVPFEIREENCMITEPVPGGLAGVKGMVEYPREWTER